MNSADVIIIGSGQGGVPLATELATRGKRVALFERGKLGGSCINNGCTPSKAFLAAAHSAGRARRAKRLGVDATVDVDFPQVMERVRSIVRSFSDGTRRRLAEAGVEVIQAEAAFTGERIVSGAGIEVTAPVIVINTGTSADIPAVPGLADTPCLTNATFFNQTKLPQRLLVIGGGYIGLELGQGMARVGSTVHVFHRNERVANNEEADVSALLQESLVEDGIELHLDTCLDAVSYAGGVFKVQTQNESVEGEQLLVATGRKPNTAALHAGASGIALDKRGYVAVDAQFRTSCAGVYAIGDVCGQPAFTHVSWEDHRRLLSILDGGNRTRDDRAFGYAMYTEPQVGRVGLTYDQACARGINARRATVRLDSVARAIEWGEERGFYRIVIDADTDKIIGATLVGYEAAELVHVLLAHIQCGSTWHVLDESVHVHPTYAEAFPGLARLFASQIPEDEPICAAAAP
ncbi:MAG: FAD-dependent oxidoreductase [Candidatus Eremiobacteraeota bacterium]|nr:FAD-dependent oxidoreductase [Candidatus Eremiobacteraeota bacterium]